MLIKLLYGTCGAKEDGVIVAKTNKSAPFCVEEKRGKDLIALGYAREVKGAGPEGGNDSEYNSIDNYSIQDLRKMAKELGLSAGGSKAELIDRIMEAEKNKLSDEGFGQTNEEESSEESFSLNIAEPEV